MNSDCKDRKKSTLRQSFACAFSGISHCIRHERNMKIHCTAAVLVLIFSIYFRLSLVEWLFILFAIGGVLSLELINTALERSVDLMTKEYHPLAKQAKDAAAGAVLIYAILSAIIGCVIFLPKILNVL